MPRTSHPNRNASHAFGSSYSLSDIEEVPVNPSPMEVQPGDSGRRCGSGHSIPLAKYSRSTSKCVRPGCQTPKADDSMAITAGSRRFARASDAIFASTWWHVSETPDLFEIRDTGAHLHLGTFRSAIHRAQQKASQIPIVTSVFVYRMKFKDAASPVAARILVEDYEIDPKHLLTSDIAGGGIARYLNQREDPGSISLISPRDYLKGKIAFTFPYSELVCSFPR
jgi:hypothetical protein